MARQDSARPATASDGERARSQGAATERLDPETSGLRVPLKSVCITGRRDLAWRREDGKTGEDVLEFHPLTDLFPLMMGTFDELVADIRACGVGEPVVQW
jgi:hypothetical protein